MSFNCPQCGATVDKNSSTCANCGAILTPTDLVEEGATIAMAPSPSDEEGATITIPDSTIEDGATIAMGDPKETIEAEATISQEDLADDGATISMPTNIEDGGTIMMPDTTEDGGTIMMPDSADDGGTIMMPDTTEDGGTIMMPDSDDDGSTIALGPHPTNEDLATIVLEDEEDGATIALPPDDIGTIPDGDGAIQATPDARSPGRSTELTMSIVGEIKLGHALQNRYRLDRVLGKGGFGAAYLAEDIKLKRACVVKQMLIPKGTAAKDIELHRSNFEREASLLVQLNHPGHPGIPEIYDYFSEAKSNYLVMKYIEGRDLNTVLKENEGGILWREAIRYVVDTCDAMRYMHTIGNEPVMHRDIKPANILLGNDGRVWLVDFGLAKADAVQGQEDMSVTQASGTIGYTPLEQWLGEAVPASDVYALGVTLHQLVTGVNPLKAYEGEYNITKVMDMHGKVAPIRKLNKELPKELDGIIQQATAEEVEQRPTPEQLKQQLEAMISGAKEAGLFTFKSGEVAHTEPELVDLCDLYRAEAERYLYSGDFERWFTIINRNDLAEAAKTAVRQGKTPKDGLERFLKLLVPNLFLRRLGKASWRLTKVAAQFIATLLIVLLLVAVAGSFIARWVIGQTISSYNWDYSSINLERDNRYSEQFLTERFGNVVEPIVTDVEVFINEPSQLDVRAALAGVELDLPVAVELQDNKPHFTLDRLNNIPLYLITDNLSAGINEGVDGAFERAPIDVTSLEMQQGIAIFSVEESGRAAFPTPTPAPDATPLPTPTPDLTLVAIFNNLEHDIILEVDGESIEIKAFDTKVIEKAPGTYDYTVTYSETGLVAAQGSRTWDVKVYRWRIDGQTENE
ncbi:MAG: protein kinase [Chloroflexota bacterium]